MTVISSTDWGTYPPLLAGSLVLFVMWWKWRKEKATVLRVLVILALPFFASWGTSLALERLGFVTVTERVLSGHGNSPSVLEHQ